MDWNGRHSSMLSACNDLLRHERLAAALAPPEHRFPPLCTSSSSRLVLKKKKPTSFLFMKSLLSFSCLIYTYISHHCSKKKRKKCEKKPVLILSVDHLKVHVLFDITCKYTNRTVLLKRGHHNEIPIISQIWNYIYTTKTHYICYSNVTSYTVKANIKTATEALLESIAEMSCILNAPPFQNQLK